MASQVDEASLEHILASDLYPKKPMVSDDKSLQVPFPLLPGESVLYLGRTSEGVVALTNFRLFIRYKDSFINLPIGVIETVECRDIFYLHVYCKDARTFRCTFPTNDSCIEWYKRIAAVMNPGSKLDDLFAFSYHAWFRDSLPREVDYDYSQELKQSDKYSRKLFDREVERMGFQLGTAWRISHINEHFDFSPTYPQYHLVPEKFLDKDLEHVANFRSSKRFPSIVWRSPNTGGVIARCSQPEVGWLGWRNEYDEALLQAIIDATFCNSNALPSEPASKPENGQIGDGSNSAQAPKLLIVDCRSYAAAWANRAKGGGCECPEYYANCEVTFMGLANIHTVRKSYQALRTLCGGTIDQASWFSALETTKWMHHISGILKSAIGVVNAVDCESRPVLVHCTDGWDRTPQIVSLAELMLDPFYRTVEGFQVLVEREWLEYGHKFGDRCGNSNHGDDLNERSPVFLQWLDCVFQILEQFPCAFQFNKAFLLKLVQHTYSCLYGTFLCNSAMERQAQKVRERTTSVWSLLKHIKFHNLLYSPAGSQVLRPSYQLCKLSFWSSAYLHSTAPTEAGLDDAHEMSASMDPDDIAGINQSELKKTKSCDDIVAALEHTSTMTRRLSDPSITCDVYVETGFIKQQQSTQQKDEHESEEDERQSDPRIQVHATGTVAFVNTASETTLVNGNDEGIEAFGEDEDVTRNENDKILTNGVTTNGHADEHKEKDYSNDDDDLTAIYNKENKLRSQNMLLEKTSAINNGVDAHSTRSVLSSTDTLTEDLALLEHKTLNGFSNESKHQRVLDAESKGQRLAISMSTSTSDISDSHVKLSNGHATQHGRQSKLDETLMNLHLVSGSRTFVNGRGQGQSDLHLCDPSSKGSLSSTDTENSTPSYYRTPSSTCPATPGTDGKLSDPWLYRYTNGLGKHLDVDGLTSFADPAQARLIQKERENKSQIEQLQRQLQAAKLALYQYASGVNGAGKHLSDNRDELLSLPDEDTEQQSLGNGSTAASDISWERVEEKEANMTLWVPDHVVTHCAGCDLEFWIVRRRHHCRNCGQVFCGECTKFSIPVPQQQLTNPVRVCRRCFENINSDDLDLADNRLEDEEDAESVTILEQENC